MNVRDWFHSAVTVYSVSTDVGGKASARGAAGCKAKPKKARFWRSGLPPDRAVLVHIK